MSGIIAQNTLLSSGLIKAPAGGGAWTFISKATASGSGTIDFTSGIDSTYKEYMFTFKNIHPSESGADFSFQGNGAGESGYNETINTLDFYAYQGEAAASAFEAYAAGDQANGTGFQNLAKDVDDDADASVSGFMHLFAPSSTTFVTHFNTRVNYMHENVATRDEFVSGYFNTTAAIDDIQFKMSSGNMDTGDICLYGLTT
jgi:hypothetical protein